MTAAKKLALISVADYLAGERVSAVKHDYVGGVVYAMSGGSYAHSIIACNIQAHLYFRLRGKPCRTLNSDTLIRVDRPRKVSFYYPDVSVVCRPKPAAAAQDEPTVICEVLSRSTRRVDSEEKLEAYLTIPSLQIYALVEQESAGVVVYRRQGAEFTREVYADLAEIIPLPELETELPLAEIYEGVEFGPEAATPE